MTEQWGQEALSSVLGFEPASFINHESFTVFCRAVQETLSLHHKLLEELRARLGVLPGVPPLQQQINTLREDIGLHEGSAKQQLALLSMESGRLQQTLDGTQGDVNSLFEQIRRMQQQVERNRRGREKAAQHLVSTNVIPVLRRRFFTTWCNFQRRRRRRKNLEYLLRGNSKVLLSIYFRKLRGFLKRRLQRGHATRYLMMHSRKPLLRDYYLRLMRFRLLKHEKRQNRRGHYKMTVDHLLIGSSKRTLGRFFGKWVTFEKGRRYRRHRGTMAHALLVNNGKLLCQRFYDKWAKWLKAIATWRDRRRLRQEIVQQLLLKSTQTLLAKWYRRLQRFAEKRLRAREREDIIAKLAELTLRSDASNTESILELKLDTDSRMAELRQKYEMLGAQVDVGLTSLSNTNNVLNRMVDRLLSVDEHLDILHKEKVSRNELPVVPAEPPKDNRAISPPRVPPSGSPGRPDSRLIPLDTRSSSRLEDPGSRQVSPRRLRPNPAAPNELEGIAKQRTTFMGYSGIIQSSSPHASDAPQRSSTARGVPAVPTAPPSQVSQVSSAGAPPGQALDRILQRLDQRQRQLDSVGRHEHRSLGGGEEMDVSRQAQRELETLRVRDLERKLGIGQATGTRQPPMDYLYRSGSTGVP